MTRAIHRRRRRAAVRGHTEDGFTMVELVVAMMIFALVIGAVVAGMGTAFNLTRQDRQRSVAANLGAQEMDTIRSTDFATLPLGVTVSTQTVGAVDYTITRTTQWVTQSAASGSCGVPSGSKLQYLSVGLSIAWVNMRGVKPVTTSTVLAPPPGTGNIEVQVYDASGASLSNVGVSVTDSNNTVHTSTTSSNGCAFVSDLSPDTYTVAISRTGYVDLQGSTNPSQSITVYSDGIYSAAFSYDQAATVAVTTAGLSGATLPSAVANAPVTLGNTSLLPSGTLVTTGTGNPLTIPNLFPYNGGYSVWVGSCADAKPTSGLTTVNVTPGGSSSATVQIPRITVQTRNSSNAARTNVAITATHVSDSGCASGESYALGSTNSSGNLTTVALPYGLWTINAAGQSGSTTCTGGTPSNQCKVTLVAGGSGATSVPALTIKW